MPKHPFRNYYERCVRLISLSDQIGESHPYSSDYAILRQKYFEIENSFYKQYVETHILPPLIEKEVIIKGNKYKFTWKMDNVCARCDVYFEKS